MRFRGLIKDSNQWAYGSYHCVVGPGTMSRVVWDNSGRTLLNDPVNFNSHFIFERRLPEDPGWSASDTFIARDVIPESVGQFTGLLDKNKKEIYEGDIVCKTVGRSMIGIVEFGEGEYNPDYYAVSWHGWYVNGIDTEFDEYQAGTYFEIIGNIHQNPELLKQ